MADDRNMRVRIARTLRASMFPKDNPFEDITPEIQQNYLSLADAILNELREPTTAMMVALGAYHVGREAWRAAIDTAKQERG